MRASLSKLSLPSSTVSSIIDKPALLATPDDLGISDAVANQVLNVGYRKGFRTVFLVNASLTPLATLASIILIKHQELRRGDEKELQQTIEKDAHVEGVIDDNVTDQEKNEMRADDNMIVCEPRSPLDTSRV